MSDPTPSSEQVNIDALLQTLNTTIFTDQMEAMVRATLDELATLRAQVAEQAEELQQQREHALSAAREFHHMQEGYGRAMNALAEQKAIMRELLDEEAVRDNDMSLCAYCGSRERDGHNAVCPVTRGRALLGEGNQ